MTNFVSSLVDFFYPPFKKFLTLQNFRYLVCGGGNTLLDIIIFFISYHFILHKQVVHLAFIAVSPHIMAFIIAFVVSFPIGFFLMRNVVFSDSNLQGRVQLFRYFVLVAVCIIMNYVFIKLFVEQFGIYPTIAKILTTIIVVAFSYVSQRKFAFKKGAV